MTIWHWLFWLASGFFFYTYFGYPALLALWRLVRPPRQSAPDPEYRPRVSVLITVRNEAAHIGPKIEDFLAQDYPADRLEIWVASDQSSDGTDDAVRAIAARDPRVHLVPFAEHVGKSVMINRILPGLPGEVIVLADARQRIEPDAVARLAAHFHDPKVAVVGAEMTLTDASGAPSGDSMGFYWRYERSLRHLESQLGLLTGISGPLYALRRTAFREFPPGSYCEDVTIALYARECGLQVRWEPEARLYEHVRDLHVEFGRKVRHLVGNYQLLCQFWPLYLPWRGSLAFTLISHKLCRLFIPLALGGILVASVALAPSHPFYLLALGAQGALYGMGLLGVTSSAWRRSRLVKACEAFCVLNWAALVALWHVLRHGPRIVWK